MIFLDLIGLVLNDIKRRKFSSFLTLFAISLGILSIFVIFLVSQGFEQSIETQFEQFGSNRLYIVEKTQGFGDPTVSKGLSDSEVNLVENRPYVKAVYPYYSKNAQIRHGNDFSTGLVFATKLNKDYFKDNNVEIEFGRAPKLTEKYSLVVGPLMGKNVFDNENIKLGSNLYINNTKFKIVGITQSVGNPQDDSNIYANINTIRELDGVKDDVGFMDVVLEEGEDVILASNNIKQVLENKLGEDSVTIVTPTQILEQLGSILSIIQLTLGGIALVALIVGAVGIINTMYVIVTEKTKEIGIMKSIGATNENILFIYMFQAGLFGFLGAIMGIIFGSISAIGFEKFAQSAGFTFLEITIDPIIATSLLFFGFIVGTIAGFLPAYKASKINIVEATRK